MTVPPTRYPPVPPQNSPTALALGRPSNRTMLRLPTSQLVYEPPDGGPVGLQEVKLRQLVPVCPYEPVVIGGG